MKNKNYIDYIGKFVFLEIINNGDKGISNYYNGEYLILNQSPNNLYGIKPVAGYGCHDLRCFPLVGVGAYQIISVKEDNKFLKKIAKEIFEFSQEINNEPKQWVSYVYGEAYKNAKRIYDILGEEIPIACNKINCQTVIKNNSDISRIEKKVILSDKMTELIDKVDSCHRERVRNIVDRIFYEIVNLK